MRRVLIVSPHFPPFNAADHHRVRMALPYFEQLGWTPHVLAVSTEAVEGMVQDSALLKTVPAQTAVTYVNALSYKTTRKFGLGSLGLRCFPYLAQAGSQLLRKIKFDLIFFSTTVFPVMAVAPQWHRRFGVPYILDFQDPWLSDYYKKPNAPPPPGGQLKYRFSQFQAGILEPYAIKSAAHLICVSSAYPKMLQQRYPSLQSEQLTVLPFGAPAKDFEILPTLNITQTIFNPKDGKRHWVYIGRGGHDMRLALSALFLSIQRDRQRHPERWQQACLHFIGTSYAPAARAQKTIEPVAQAYGVADLVHEVPGRIPYFEALQVLKDSHAILIIGSDDAGYTASKVYPCVLAQKAILGIFHQDSSVVDILRRCQAGSAVTFNQSTQPEQLVAQLTPQLDTLLNLPQNYHHEIDWQAFSPYTAESMARKLCQVFEQSLNHDLSRHG